MATADILYQALNVGVVDRKNLHRVDLTKMRLAAEDQTNILALATGSAFLRPGTEYIANTNDDLKARPISFVAGNDAAYQLEMTDNTMRVVDCDTNELITRASVTTAVSNGDFGSATDWTLASSSGQTSSITGGTLELSARAHGAMASCTQTLAIIAADQQTVHALRIVVSRGPVNFRLGSAAGGDELIQETSLDTGEHSLAFDPNGSSVAYIKFFTELPYKVIVDSCTIEAAGVMDLPTPWEEADLPYIQPSQSIDIMFVAVAGYRQRKIERRGSGDAAGLSWSVCEYHSDDGPFTPGRTARVTLEPSATEGDITLTASGPFFTSSMIGGLFKLWHNGQRIDTYLAAENQYTPTFLVTGITETNFEERKYTYTISDTWVGTIRNYRSFDGDDVEFHQVRREQASATIAITANATYTNDDNDDNAITWVKFGFEDGAYTSGEAHIVSTYDGGGGYGICRITAVASSTSASAQVVKPFLGNGATEEWQEGEWSSRVGFPAGVAFHGGRLYWGGDDRLWGSVSDSFYSFDEEFDGDAAPILRSIAIGGQNEVKWIAAPHSLFMGTDSRIAQGRASTLDEVVTASNLNIKNVDKIPCSHITPVELKNDRMLFVGGDGRHLYEINYSNEAGDFIVTKFSLLNDELFASGIVQMAVTNFPDQRIWIVCADGTAVCILYEPVFDISCAIPIVTRSGDLFEGVASVPGSEQDRVYFTTKRIINGQTKRFIELLALDSEAAPDTITKCVDCHVTFAASASGAVTGLGHLEGEPVVAWADSIPLDTLEVSDTTYFLSSTYETDYTGLWSADRTTRTSGQADPDGGTSATKVLETAENNSHNVGLDQLVNRPDFTVGSYRYEVKAKAIGTRWLLLSFYTDGFIANFYQAFDLNDGVLGVASGDAGPFELIDAEIESLGNGWYTCTLDFFVNATADDNYLYNEIRDANGQANYLGDITKGVYLYTSKLNRLLNTSGTIKTFTVASSQAQLDNIVTTGGCIGLPYRGRYKTARLAYGPEGSSPFMSNKSVAQVGLLLADYVRSGVKYGHVFDNTAHPLLDLPALKNGTTATEVVTGVTTDEQKHPVGGEQGFDPRICVELNSPKPAAILSIILEPTM